MAGGNKVIPEMALGVISTDTARRCSGEVEKQHFGVFCGLNRERVFFAEGGAVTGAPGYNCANAIADDLGIKKFWSPVKPLAA